jgi:hypothetical protein
MIDKNHKHYVDNKKLLEAIIEYRKKTVEFRAGKRKIKPPIPNYIGECMLLIAQRLSYKPNFINYSYREEMISDGIENCVSYIDNFDPEKSNNPFAYFTQIIYFAFLRRIQKEKKQLYIKHKSLENSLIMNTLIEQNEFDESEFAPAYVDMDNENMNEFILAFEDNLDKKKIKRKKGLEKFIEDEEVIDEETEDDADSDTR